MTKVIYKTGDIFTSYAQAIGHGVNIYGVMGHGIAVQFKRNFPSMHEEYKQMCADKALMPGSVFVWSAGRLQGGKEGYVYNIASQDAPGPNGNYGWLLSGVHLALTHADEHEVKTVALPRIGAGVAGLEWDKVRQVLELVASWHDADIEAWTLPDAATMIAPRKLSDGTWKHSNPNLNPMREDGLYGKAAQAADGDWYGSH